MKRRVNVLLALLVVVLIADLASAVCNLDATLVNQDPYPARPGESVEVVFQLSGVSDPSCGLVTFEVIENFPFILESGDGKTIIQSGTYSRGYKSELVAPYRLLVNENALDGDSELEVIYSSSSGVPSSPSYTKKFNISIKDVLTDFEVSIKDYNYNTDMITFEILNIGENDAEALTVDVPKQDNLEIKGSTRNIVGSLDANEDTTFTFEAIPHNGEIALTILYTDETNIRRTLSKKVNFDSIYFEDRAADQGINLSGWFYVALILIIIMIISWYRERRRRKKKREEYRRLHGSSHSHQGRHEHHEMHHHKKR